MILAQPETILNFDGWFRVLNPPKLVEIVQNLHRKGLDAHGKQNSEKS